MVVTMTVYSRLVLAPVEAGFPSPAGDYMESPLNFNERLVPRPASTFCVRVRGDSMTGVHIQNGDLLVVDRSLDPRNGDIVIAAIDGELTVKRLKQSASSARLQAANPRYRDIPLNDERQCELWGVVTYVIHKTR